MLVSCDLLKWQIQVQEVIQQPGLPRDLKSQGNCQKTTGKPGKVGEIILVREKFSIFYPKLGVRGRRKKSQGKLRFGQGKVGEKSGKIFLLTSSHPAVAYVLQK